MKVKILLLLSCLLTLCCAVEAIAENWKELKGEHFIIYFVRDRRVAGDTLNKAEKYYKKIADELGYARYSDFWAWDRRVKIYIYPDRDSYRSFVEAHGHARWSVGIASYENREIISYAQSEEFLDSILPHEITHLIFRDYVGQRNIPIWIDEGVAQWEEKGKRQQVKRKIKELLQIHSPIPIERMMTLNIGKVKNEAIVELYYVEAVSLVDFLIGKYGVDNFIFFCRQLRDGKDVNEALRFAYPTSIRNIDELQTKWLKYLKEE